MQLSRARIGSVQGQIRPQHGSARPQRLLPAVATRAAFDESSMGVEVPDAFKQALMEAMQRNKEQIERARAANSSSASDYDRSSWRSSENGSSAGNAGSWRSSDNGSSAGSWRSSDNGSSTYDRSSWRSSPSSSNGSSYSPAGSSSSWRTPPAAQAQQSQNTAATPLLQMLATALNQSRATVERLQAEEAEIENLIQKEQKQVERLEWLLTKVQQDYAYFNTVERRLNQSSAATREAERVTSGYVEDGNGGYKW